MSPVQPPQIRGKPFFSEGGVDVGQQPSWQMLVALCLVNVVEGIDVQLVPGCQFAFQKGGIMKLTDVAILIMVQVIFLNMAAPLWGIIADRGCIKRKHILMIGALGEATVAILMAFVPGFPLMLVLRGMSGFFIACLRPIASGIVADCTSEDRRGKVFSYVQSAFLVGVFVTTLVAGNLANLQVGPIPGWRALWALSGVVVALISVVIGILMVEPSRQVDSDGKKCCSTVVEEIFIMVQFLTIPTFSIIVLQGIFQELPWTVIGHSLLFFKLSGLEDWEGSVLASECPVVAVFGSILGGSIADFLAQRFGYQGRPLSAQISVALAIPLIYLWFAGIPPGSQAAVFGVVYFMVIACFGLVGTWAHAGTSLPILSDIVPSKNRSKVMAAESALESSIATLVGPLFVANLANAFGYDFSRLKAESKDIASATALGQAMAATICMSWCVTFFGYIFLHISYPSHMRKLNAQMKAEKAEAEAAEEAI